MTRQLGNPASGFLDVVAAKQMSRVQAAGRQATDAVALVFEATWGLLPPPGEQQSFSVIPLLPYCAH